MTESTAPRLLVVTNLDRLGPIVRESFAPLPMHGVRNYLAAIAELPRRPTRAVLVGHDPNCRNPEAAVRALRQVAGPCRVIYCCEPIHEGLARRLLEHGADDYVLHPPEPHELERALGIPSRSKRRQWIETPSVAPVPSPEELARLADVLPVMYHGDGAAVDGLAELLRCALDADWAAIILEDASGHAGTFAQPQDEAEADATLTEAILSTEGRPIGQLRIGPGRRGGYSHDDTAKLRHYGVLIGRVLESARQTANWRKLALTDDLTGLANRRRLQEFLDDIIPTARKSRSTVTVLYFDIDDFKRYNDEYGHDAGDQILVDIGRLFVKCSRESDLVARYGGDEFVVVFWDAETPRTPGSRHPRGVREVLQRFRESLKTHTFKRLGPDAKGRLTISGGIAHYPWDAHNMAELIDVADQALLQAKRAGKDRLWVIGGEPI